MLALKYVLCLCIFALASLGVDGVPVQQADVKAEVEVTTTGVIFERQEEGSATEVSVGVPGPDVESGGPSDDSEEASAEAVTEAVVAAEAVAATVPPRKVPLKTTFGEEWSIVTGNEIQGDEPAEANDVDNAGVKSPSKFVDKPTTDFKEQWAYVNGNVSETTKKPEAVFSSTKAPVTVAASSTTVRTFQQEWDVVVGNENVAQEQQQQVANTEAPEVVTEAVNNSPEDDEEDDEEDVTEKAEVSSAKPVVVTKKPVALGGVNDSSFNKEWSIVTGQAQAGQRADGPQAKAACECGKIPFKVSGGGVNEWPWTAAIVRNGYFAGGRPHCGATLINNKYVLTAANCMDGLLPGRTEVWLTVHDSLQEKGASGTLKLAADKILMHPNYNRRTKENDIALVRLLEPVNLGERYYFVPACVPAGSADYTGTMGKMAAWGSQTLGIYNNRLSNNKLCKADMPILANEVCNRDTSHVGKITDNMVCAGYITPTNEGSCIGDAGGGLIIGNGGRHTLIGITSFGYSPDRAYSPTVHTRVSEYADWILHNTRDGDWCD